MTLPIAIVLGVVLVALVLFTLERIPMEMSSLIVVMLLAVSGVLTPEQAFDGFSNPTVIFIFTLLAMTRGLASTGVIQLVGQRMAFFARYGHSLFVVAMMTVVCAFSSFISNTVTTAAFLPVAVGAAERARVPPSKVLMPLAYSSILGGTILLIGTSTNLAVSSAMAGLGLAPIGFTELAPLGLPLAVLGIVLVALLGRWLLPARTAGEGEEGFPAREYLAEVVLTPGSRYVGQPLSELTQGLGMRVMGVVRGEVPLEPSADLVLTGQDRLLLEEDRLSLLRIKDLKGVGIMPDVTLSEHDGDGEDVVLVEATVPVGSSLVGRSLKETFFAEHYGLVVLAIHRRPAIQRLTKLQVLHGLFGTQPLSGVPLMAGDVLLLRGPRARARALADGRMLTFLGEIDYQPPRYGKAALAVLIFLTVLGLGVAEVLPLAVAGLCGLVAMLATRCVDPRVAFRVDWRVLLLIGSMMALGVAMETSGAGRYVGRLLVPLADDIGARGVLCVLMVLTVVLSAPMSNQAAALVLLPVAVGVAGQLQLDPRPFAIGVCLAASYSFITPLEPSCVMVLGPGRYRFTDFFRLGTPLTAALLALLTVFVPQVWPF